MDYDDNITTVHPEIGSSHTAAQRLYDILIPLLGIFIISLNALVVFSSGLLLKTRKFCCLTIVANKMRLHRAVPFNFLPFFSF